LTILKNYICSQESILTTVTSIQEKKNNAKSLRGLFKGEISVLYQEMTVSFEKGDNSQIANLKVII
jgi:hypothetical protein